MSSLRSLFDSSQSTSKSGRILELDALRAIAALNLLLFHYTLVFPNKYGFNTPLGFDFPYGKYGVQLFFMLSGFVNAMTLLKKQEPGKFLSSRVLRIFPVYWLVVILNVVLLSAFAMFGQSVTPDATLANLTAMPMLFGYENWEPVTWTLQVEILFYGLLIVLFVGGAFQNTVRTMLILLGISALGLPLIHHLQSASPGSSTTLIATTLSEVFILEHLPLFAIGISLHEIWSGRGKAWGNGLVICAAAFVFHLNDHRGHNPVVTTFFIGLLTMSAYGKLPVLRIKPLMFISGISYALYLFHNNLGCVIIRWVHDMGLSPLASIILATVVSVVFATAITKYFEQPLTKYLKSQISGLHFPFFNRTTPQKV